MTPIDGPDGLDLTPQEEAAAEELGVQPETLQLPAGIHKGMVVFEMTDGSFGFRPLNDNLSLFEAYSLVARISAGLQADITANKVIEAQKQLAIEVRKQQAEAAKAPRIAIPGRRGR